MSKIEKEWKPIANYPGYFVSNYGEVYSNKTRKLLKFGTTRRENGYYLAPLSKSNKLKSILVHRLVYEAFVGNIPEGFQINHKDENKLNNRVDNLELVTPSENIRYGTAIKRGVKARLTKYPNWSSQLRKPCINETTGKKYESASEAARQTGGNANSIINACNKKRKTYKNQIWSYL